jgi:ribokinase
MRPSKPALITVFGSINADMIFSLDRLPIPGQTLLAQQFRLAAGGKGANQAVAAARDDAQVAMVGAVGRDALADTALAGLRDSRVDLSHVALRERPTGCAAVHTDSEGHNQIVVALGANAELSHTQVDDSLLERSKLILLQMETPVSQVESMLVRARNAGVFSILNLAPAVPLSLVALRSCGMIVVNEDEGRTLAEWIGCAPDAASLYAALGVDIVRTLGGQGAEACSSASGLCRTPARPIAPVDTTAAGDCFIGVLAAALARAEPLTECMHRAGTAAALCCLRHGSQSSLPHYRDTDEALMRWLPECERASGRPDGTYPQQGS